MCQHVQCHMCWLCGSNFSARQHGHRGIVSSSNMFLWTKSIMKLVQWHVPLFFSMRLRCIHISKCFCWHFHMWCLVSVMVQVIRRLERGHHVETISLHAEIRRYLKNKPLFSTPKIRLKMWKLDNLEPYKGETDSERWERWEREWKRMGPRTLNVTSEAWHRSQ